METGGTLENIENPFNELIIWQIDDRLGSFLFSCSELGVKSTWNDLVLEFGILTALFLRALEPETLILRLILGGILKPKDFPTFAKSRLLTSKTDLRE